MKATDKVVMSLMTKDAVTAKALFAAAYAALCRPFDAVRSGPVTLGHKQVVALAGEFDRRRTARLEVDYDPDRLAREQTDVDDAIEDWRQGDGSGEVPGEIGLFLAAIQRPSGPYLLALDHSGGTSQCGRLRDPDQLRRPHRPSRSGPP